jgi:hypothetical protein
MVRQLARHGFVEEAYRELKPMVSRVVTHGDFHEWWSRDNQPRGSKQFRGSAGVLGKAIEELLAWAEANADKTNSVQTPRSKAQPPIGYSDSDDPEVVRWHVRPAKAAGLDAFLVSWWGGANVSGAAFEKVVLPVAAKETFKVAMCSELAQFHHDVEFVIPRDDGATLKGYLHAIADAGADAALLTSFNEWPETTIVEPSSSWPDPYFYLKLLADWNGVGFRAPPLPSRKGKPPQ